MTLFEWCIKNNRQDLLGEWDREKNEFSPSDISYAKNIYAWWKCKKGHSFKSKVSNRTVLNRSCPYCKNKKVLSGYNDLKTTNPRLSHEWDYSKNYLTPEQVTAGSHLKVWWIGECGHNWQATVFSRNRGSGCPICRKESSTSFPEQTIFYYLHKVFPDAISQDVNALGGRELDIYIPSIQTGIEYDGFEWHKNIERDLEKDRLCSSKNIRLIRFREKGCPKLANSTSNIIVCEHRNTNSLNKAIKDLCRFLKIDIKIDIKKDEQLIKSQYIESVKQNSIVNKYPHLLKEWDYEKNDVNPAYISSGSELNVWWKCKKGHSWQAPIYNRIKGSNCPVCSNQKTIPGLNDLKTLFPQIASEWDYEKNEDEPNNVNPGSPKRVWWKCKNGHSFVQSINHRTARGQACPVCAGHIVVKGFNDLETVAPFILNEWDYELNQNEGLFPHMFSKGSNKEVWWKCSKCGQTWKMSIAKKMAGRLCPNCTPKKRAVRNIDTGEVFPTIKAAALSCNGNPSDIRQVCLGKFKTSKGYRWEFTKKD